MCIKTAHPLYKETMSPKYNIPTIKLPESAATKLVTFGALGVGLYFFHKWLQKQGKEAADKLIGKDGDAGIARIIIAAMNPSGVDLLKRVDGTNSDMIYNAAPQIKDLNKVIDYYKLFTKGGNLQDDLTKELSTDGYDKFLALATHGTSGSKKYSTTRTDIPANMWVITKAAANVRKAPKVQSKYIPGNNIVKLVGAHKAVGISTGKYVYDESGDTTFIEFYTLGSKAAGKQFFYIANSQVELISAAEKTKREKTGKIPLEVLSGLGGVLHNQYIAISRHALHLFDERFNTVGIAPAHIAIGFPIMRLHTQRGDYLKVQTIQGAYRWVGAADIQIQHR